MRAMSYLDPHTHLADRRLESSLGQILERSRAAGVTAWLQGGIGPEDWERQAELSRQYQGFIPVYGLHPWWVASHLDSEVRLALMKLPELIKGGVALGETGLDFHDRFQGTESSQQMAFETQLVYARIAEVPLILHVVRAHQEVIKALQPEDKGLVHSFSGGLPEAKEYIRRGFLISFSGSITKKGFKGVKAAAAEIPLESLAVETDAPDQTPSDLTGLNEPVNLLGVAEKIAELRGITRDEVLVASTQNCERVFGERIRIAIQ